MVSDRFVRKSSMAPFVAYGGGGVRGAVGGEGGGEAAAERAAAERTAAAKLAAAELAAPNGSPNRS